MSTLQTPFGEIVDRRRAPSGESNIDGISIDYDTIKTDPGLAKEALTNERYAKAKSVTARLEEEILRGLSAHRRWFFYKFAVSRELLAEINALAPHKRKQVIEGAYQNVFGALTTLSKTRSQATAQPALE